MTKRELPLPQSLKLKEYAESVDCLQLLRYVPSKRMVILAKWQQQMVIVKLFFGYKARLALHREVKGAQRLKQAGITTPNLLYSGRLPHSITYLAIFTYIGSATDVAEIWQQATLLQKQQVLTSLLKTLASHHRQGIIQQDLHFKNFLQQGEQIYTLDTATIAKHRVLSKKTCLRHIALLFAQLNPSDDAHCLPLLRVYFEARGWQALFDQANFKKYLRHLRIQRQRRYLTKIFRNCSEVFAEKTWARRILVKQAYRQQLWPLLHQQELFDMNTTILKAGRTCTVARIQVNGKDLLVKRYNIKGFWHGLARALQASRASHCWYNAHLLQFNGIATPEPIAILEERWGWLRRRAYFVTEYVVGELASHYCDKASIAEQALALKRILAVLHLYKACVFIMAI